MSARRADIERKTNETDVRVALDLDTPGATAISTGIGFLDHMWDAVARHARIGLVMRCAGDLHVDDHHTAEDAALAFGAALDKALGDRRGVRRFAHAYAPLDESLARCVVDLSGRPHCSADLRLVRDRVGDLSTEMIPHVFASLATTARMTLHIDVLRGANDHHRAEAAFKAFALALREAVALDGGDQVPSTKGVL